MYLSHLFLSGHSPLLFLELALASGVIQVTGFLSVQYV